jgi:hypothetical protein
MLSGYHSLVWVALASWLVRIRPPTVARHNAGYFCIINLDLVLRFLSSLPRCKSFGRYCYCSQHTSGRLFDLATVMPSLLHRVGKNSIFLAKSPVTTKSQICCNISFFLTCLTNGSKTETSCTSLRWCSCACREGLVPC